MTRSLGFYLKPDARKHLKIIAFLAPVFIFATVFVYYPFVKTIINSFCHVNAKGKIIGFAGFENYAYVFRRRDFAKSLENTLLLTAINVPATLIISLCMALLAVKKRRLSFLYELLFTLPMAVSMSAACMIFKAMFSPSLGFINAFFGLDIGWFENRNTALYTVLILTVWMGVGFDFLLFQSALRAISPSIIESSRLDGAGFFTRLFKIQLPLISPTILYVVCTNAVLAMMTSGPMIIITQGGPSRSTTTLMYMMFSSGYSSSNYGLAAVISVIAFCLTLGFTLIAFAFEKKKVHYQ